jgi:hypothetical protein
MALTVMRMNYESFVKMGSQVVVGAVGRVFGKAILRVVFWWDVGMGKVKVK